VDRQARQNVVMRKLDRISDPGMPLRECRCGNPHGRVVRFASMWFPSHASPWKSVLSVGVLFGQMECSSLARDRLNATRLNDLAGNGGAPEDPLRNTNCGAKVAGGILATQSFPKPISETINHNKSAFIGVRSFPPKVAGRTLLSKVSRRASRAGRCLA
jgi:hypothetical protein